ncbi:DUF4817 domain-containing protein [Trichonephila clavipes]|nr:DUF4817 domain-containing protein [Trichonephila clavipes]
MSLPNPVEQKSYVINNKLSRVMKEVAEESMKRAAVEENSSSPDNLLTEMRKAIWAVWGHSCSTDDEPMHWFCPTNPNTWCKYNAAINNNLQNYKHKPSVAKAVRDVIKPVFADLSHPALLKKCLGDQNDHQARRRFVEWAQNDIAVVPDFHKRILFSDEAHFWLNGYVNKQNCRIWSEANPQVYVETQLHTEKLTLWCALWAEGILLQNDEGHNVTVNGDRYRAMITIFFIPELSNHEVQELWFQQDGATCHTARATIDLLKDTFGDHLISRFGPVNRPPGSCDLTPLDYFLWDYLSH